MTATNAILALYAMFAAGLFFSGFLYKRYRDRRESRINPKFNFNYPAIQHQVRKPKSTMMAE